MHNTSQYVSFKMTNYICVMFGKHYCNKTTLLPDSCLVLQVFHASLIQCDK